MANHQGLKQIKKRQALVIGSPIGHSLSPLMHRYWLKQQQVLGGAYDLCEVSPFDLETTLHRFWTDVEVVGMNVTIPHKQEISRFCYALSPRAQRTDSVNTLIRHQDGWFGDSSDGWGFVASIRASFVGSSQEAGEALDFSGAFGHVVMLGAGGAASSIADALFEEGLVGTRLTIINRNLERASKLCDHLKSYWRDATIVATEINDRDLLKEADLFIQTTSMGLAGGPPFDYSLEGLPQACVVADIVYNPLKTACLVEAAKRGNPTVDGLGMLMYQGVVGFQSWFGAEPLVDEGLRSFLLASLRKADHKSVVKF